MDKPTKIQEENLANFNRNLETVRSFVEAPMLTCNNCRHLHIINDKEIYAYCHKTGYIFEPFVTDTRTHYCSLGATKEARELSKTRINSNKNHIVGWQPISEYSREKYDWVLVKYFDGAYEFVPEVAEMRVDGKWYNRSGAEIPDIFDIKYFFNMQQLDKKV